MHSALPLLPLGSLPELGPAVGLRTHEGGVTGRWAAGRPRVPWTLTAVRNALLTGWLSGVFYRELLGRCKRSQSVKTWILAG